jgi:hypothetical protein
MNQDRILPPSLAAPAEPKWVPPPAAAKPQAAPPRPQVAKTNPAPPLPQMAQQRQPPAQQQAAQPARPTYVPIVKPAPVPPPARQTAPPIAPQAAAPTSTVPPAAEKLHQAKRPSNLGQAAVIAAAKPLQSTPLQSTPRPGTAQGNAYFSDFDESLLENIDCNPETYANQRSSGENSLNPCVRRQQLGLMIVTAIPVLLQNQPP